MSDRDAYFSRAQGWADDVRSQNARSRKAAWTIAGIAVAVALFEAVALALLTPLKTVQPVTLLVDRHTGYVQAIDPLTPRRLAADDALTQSYLAQYVASREGFDRATVATDYKRVALWSTGRARSAYLSQMPATNPASPFQRYPNGAAVSARVKSVSRLQPGVALVRFDTQVSDQNGGAGQVQPWISVVRYRYVDAPMRMEDRLVNPLGFQVTAYRRDAEAPPPPALSGSASPAMVAAAAEPSAPTVVIETRVRGGERPPVDQSASSRFRRGETTVGALPTPARQENIRAADRREIPIASLPIGSPLSPSGAPLSASAERQP